LGKEGKVRTREVPTVYLLFYEMEGGAQEGFEEAGRLTGGGRWGALDKAERGSREGSISTATFVESDIYSGGGAHFGWETPYADGITTGSGGCTGWWG